MRYDIENGYNQKRSVLGMMSRLTPSDFRYLEDDHPGLVEEFKLLFPDAEIDESTVKALYSDYVNNERVIKANKITWSWEEITFVEE
jgi:hypothetical protein